MSSFIDSMAHLDDVRVDNQESILQRAARAGVIGVINAGVDPAGESWDWQLNCPDGLKVYRAFGIHPMAVGRRPLVDHLRLLQELLERGNPVALGELGLDARDGFAPLDQQEAFLLAQLDLACEMRLPIIVHCVQALGRLLELFKARGALPNGGLLHAYSGSWEMAQAFIDLGFFISFGGMVTKPNAKKCRRTAQNTPSDRLLVESDTPDHPPAQAKVAQSEPALIPLIVQELAKIRGESVEQISQVVTKNATRLFRLKA